MEYFSGDTEESPEEIPGRKKSKLKSLKSRLFGRTKREGGEENTQLSHSVSDIAAGKGLGSEEDLVCCQQTMGSRAFSHDSIFLADQALTDAEPARVLSQENVHSKIKALQMQLQQQKMHLGPPPLVLPIRRQEDPESHSEDDGLPHSPLEISGGDVTSQGDFIKALPQQSSRPLSPVYKPVPTKYVPPASSHTLPLSVPSNPSVVEPPLDFNSPPQFTPCLDTSAARHRMSVKPRNQRTSTKKRVDATDSRSHLNTLNNIDQPESVRQDERLSTQEEVSMETEQGEPVNHITSQCLPKSPEVAPITSVAASKSSSLTYSQQHQALPERAPPIPSVVLRVKPHRPVDVKSTERPHSSFIPSELKNKGESGFEVQVMAHDKINALNKAGATNQVQGETETTRGIKRPSPGSGSFHFSITTAKNRDAERPRSGSFAGVFEQIEARHRTEGRPFSSLKEKEELRDLNPRGKSFAVERLRQDGAQHKSSVLPWDRKDSLKKVESVTHSKIITTETEALKGKEVDSRREVMEEAMEAREVDEEEARMAFGVKLRSTSQSLRIRSEASPKRNSKPPVSEEQCDQQKRQDTSDNASHVYKKLSTNLPSTQSASGEQRLTDPTTSGVSLPVKNDPPSTCKPQIMPTEVQTTPPNLKEGETALAAPQEPQPTTQTATPEVSWMSLAMEKTRCIQQLFSSRFPRDLTGVQTAAPPQEQVQTTSQKETPLGAQIQTQAVKIQRSVTSPEAANPPSTDSVKVEIAQGRSQAQPVKPLLVTVQQKTSASSPEQPNTSREPQALKQANESQAHLNTAQPASQPSAQTNPWKTQSPLHTFTKTETSSQFAQGSVTQSLAPSYLSSGQQQHQPPWSNRVLHPANQLKSATSASATAPLPASAIVGGERKATMQGKEGTSPSGRRTAWAGSVSEKAAFLEKRAEWTTTPGTKEVELKKAQTEAQTSGESLSMAKTSLPSKDTKPEERQGIKPTESSPTKVPDRPQEEKWLRKNVASSSPRSSSPTMQSMSEGSQPSWMEMAKRKSMAWSDKSMD